MSNTNASRAEIDIDANRRKVLPGDLASFKKLFEITTIISGIEASSGQTLLPTNNNMQDDDKKHRTTVYNYIASVQIAANWYDARMSVEKGWRIFYNIITLFLIGAIPLFLFWAINKLVEPGNTSSAATASAITAVVTSLVGLQKAWGAWSDSHKRFGSRWRARAALRDIIYSDRDRWCARAIDSTTNKLVPDFVDALAVSIGKARAIIRTEQQAFFDTYDAPSFNLGDYLTGSRNTATTLLQDMTKPIQGINEVRTEVNRKQGEIDALTKIITALPNGDPSEVPLKTNLTTKQNELIVARGKLAALLAAT